MLLHLIDMSNQYNDFICIFDKIYSSYNTINAPPPPPKKKKKKKKRKRKKLRNINTAFPTLMIYMKQIVIMPACVD